RFGNASGFTLVMTGDFTLDRVRPLVARYLASLPAGTPERPRATVPPPAPRRIRFAAGTGPRARTEIVLSGPFDGSSESNDHLHIVADVTQRALSDRLRERLGGTYSVNVDPWIELVPPLRYRIRIGFEADPARIDSLAAAALAEVSRLRRTGPSTTEVDRV